MKIFLLLFIVCDGFKIRAANFPDEDIFAAISRDKKHISSDVRNLEKFRSIRAKNKELRRVSQRKNNRKRHAVRDP